MAETEPTGAQPAPPPQTEGPGNGPFLVIANRNSGTNARDGAAIDRAMSVLEEAGARLRHWDPGDDLGALVEEEIAAGARSVVAAGGDGTAMALAQAMRGRPAAMSVLPLGTFNYFARGLGLPETPESAARALLGAERRRIRIGTVNGQAFLNNASLGIYPSILKEREEVYRRFGRRRLMAHWSVVRTFWRFQRPMRLTLTQEGAGGQDARSYRTPLLFVARSAYQLRRFGLSGEEAIHRDRMALLIGRGESRAALFRLAWRLVTRSMQEGRDYDLVEAARVRVETAGRRRPLLAFDGEKRRDASPFDFAMSDDMLEILLPVANDPAGTGSDDPAAPGHSGGASAAAPLAAGVARTARAMAGEARTARATVGEARTARATAEQGLFARAATPAGRVARGLRDALRVVAGPGKGPRPACSPYAGRPRGGRSPA